MQANAEALEYCQHETKTQAIWSGQGYTFRYPFGRFHSSTTEALAKIKEPTT